MTTNKELGCKLDQILETVQQIKIDDAARVERDRVIQEKVAKHDAVLEGNGTEGLKTSVAKLQDQMGRLIGVVTAVASIVGIQLIAIVFGLLTHTLQFP